MTRKSYRLVAVLTLCALVFTTVPAMGAPTAPDIKGHWAEAAIEQLVDLGAVSGLPDGTFRPDLTVTRAEFVSMVNKSLRIAPVTVSSRFKDVKPEDWFAGQVEAAASYGYVTGNPDGTFSPYRPITREQAAAMLVRVFGFSKLATAAEQDAVLTPFADADKVSPWAKADVATAVSLGLLSGYTASTLAPRPADLSAAGWQQWEAARSTEQREAVLKKLGSTGLITRAQTAAILVRALDLKPVIEGTIFDKAGTYGPEEDVETITGNVIIKADGVTLQNLIITGDLIIDEKVGDGTVVLEKVTVKGDTEVKGGGTESVIFRDCTLHGTVTVEKVDGQIRIVAEGSTSVPKVVLQSGAILISRDDGSFEQVLLPKDLDENTEVVLTGNFAEIEVAAENANLTIGEGSTVNSLVLTEDATGTQVDLDKKASVTTVTADAEVAITGQGTIGKAEINVDGVTIEQKPDKVVLEEGVKANVGGKDVSEPKKSSGGGGGGGDTTVSVSAISVEGVPVVGATLVAKVTPDKATVDYQWMRADAKDGAYENIPEATEKTYELVADDEGKLIKVKVTGTGRYKGTVTSDPIGSILSVDIVESMITALLEAPTIEAPEVPDVVNKTRGALEKDGKLGNLDAIYNYLEYLENAEAVAEAKGALESLTAEGQALVDENLKTKLEAAVGKIDELKNFVISNTTVGVGTYKEDYSGLTEGAKGRIMVTPVWPFYLADGLNSSKGLTSLVLSLHNNENEIVRNTANFEKLTFSKTSNWPTRTSGSFDLGVARPSSSGSWDNGFYELSGDEVTPADLPNKVVVEFTYKGVLFVIEKEVEFIPDMFIAGAIQATPDTIQSELDKAEDGATIILNPGEYGTLYLRQSELSRSVDVTNWAGDGDVERYRAINNLSIIGTAGAKVDQITVEAQLYVPGSGHSNDDDNHLSSYISISNLTIKDIEFTGNKPVAVNLQSIWSHSSVNGLTIDGCTLTGQAADKTAETSFLLRADGDTSAEIKDKSTNELIMTTGRSNLTVKNCTVDNVWMPINITEWNMITISDNNFSNSGRNDILVTGPSTDLVSITGNTLDRAGERSIRLNKLSGEVIITGNTITNCKGRDDGSLMRFSAAGDSTTVYLSGNSWNGDTDEQANTANKLIIDPPAVVTVGDA